MGEQVGGGTFTMAWKRVTPEQQTQVLYKLIGASFDREYHKMDRLLMETYLSETGRYIKDEDDRDAGYGIFHLEWDGTDLKDFPLPYFLHELTFGESYTGGLDDREFPPGLHSLTLGGSFVGSLKHVKFPK